MTLKNLKHSNSKKKKTQTLLFLYLIRKKSRSAQFNNIFFELRMNGHLSGENSIIWKDICTPVSITALFTTAQTGKQPEWAHSGILLSHKKE